MLYGEGRREVRERRKAGGRAVRDGVNPRARFSPSLSMRCLSLAFCPLSSRARRGRCVPGERGETPLVEVSRAKERAPSVGLVDTRNTA